MQVFSSVSLDDEFGKKERERRKERVRKNFFNWKLKEFSREKSFFVSQSVEEVDIFVPKCVIDLVCLRLLVSALRN